MKIDKDRLCEIIDGEDKEYEQVGENLTLNTKHSDTTYRMIVKNKLGEYFSIIYSHNYDWGIHEDEFDLNKVKRIEVTTYEYVYDA